MANLSNINNKFLVTTGGNVGIGVTGPLAPLDVFGAAVQNGSTPGIKLSSSNTQQTVFAIGNTGTRQYELAVGGTTSSVPGAFYIYDNNAADFRITLATSGNVGIGTTSPGSYDTALVGNGHKFLNVQASSTNYAVQTLAGDSGTNGNRLGYLTFVNDNNNATYKYSAWIGSEVEGTTANKQGGRLILSTTSDNSTAGPIERMRIDSSGNATFVGNIYLADGTQRNIIGPTNQSLGLFSRPNNASEGIIFSTDGGTTTEMFIQDGGRVNIGPVNSDLPSALNIVSINNYNETGTGGRDTGGIIIRGGTTGDQNNTGGIGFAFGTGTAGISGYQNGTDADRVGLKFFTHGSGTGSAAAALSMIIKSGGEVGIGTSSPQRLLQLRSTNEATGIFLERTSNYGFVQYNQVVGSVETYHLGFVNNNTFSSDILVANESGNVGIGTTSPQAPLQVNADIYSIIRLGADYNYSENREWQFRTNTFGSGSWGGIALQQSTAQQGNTFATRFGVDINGNVGIGTTTPLGKLSVADGDIEITGANAVSRQIRFMEAGVQKFAITNVGSDDSVRFYTAVGGDILNLKGGNVGIGTNTIQNKFVVRDTGSAFNSTIQTSTVSIISKEMTDNAYHSILQLVAVRQSLTTGNASQGYLGFSTVDDSNNQGQLDAGRIAIVNEQVATRNSATALSFWTNPGGTQTTAATEKMRINSAGFLKASNNGSYDNATSTVHELVSNSNGGQIAKFTHKGTVPYGLQIRYSQVAPNITDNYFFLCSDSSANRLIIWGNGNVQNQNNSYGAISDERLKENIVDASPKLDDLMKVKIRNFNLIGDDKKQIGVIAQELEDVFPSLVEDVKKEKSDETTKSVKYSVFVPILIKAIQELKAEIELLKSK